LPVALRTTSSASTSSGLVLVFHAVFAVRFLPLAFMISYEMPNTDTALLNVE